MTQSDSRRLSTNGDKGWAVMDDERVVILGVNALQAFVDRVAMVAGTRVAATLLYHAGLAVGHTRFEGFSSKIHSEEELWSNLDRQMSARGWGHCSFGGKEKTPGGFRIIMRTNNNPLTFGRTTAPEPTCHVIRGFIVGCLEEYLEKKATNSTETSCQSRGDQFCTFEINLVG